MTLQAAIRVLLPAGVMISAVVSQSGNELAAFFSAGHPLQDSHASALESRKLAEKIYAEGEELKAQGTAESQEKSLEKYREALALWRALGDRRREADTLHKIAWAYFLLTENQRALEYYDQAVALCRTLSDLRGEASVLSHIGLVYWAWDKPEKALESYDQALRLLRSNGAGVEEANTLNNLGLAYWSLGQFEKALDCYNQALKLYRALAHRVVGEAATLNGIGAVFSRMGNHEKALDYYRQALTLSRAMGDRREEATALHNIGSAHLKSGRPREALENYNEALALREMTGERLGRSYTLLGIARVERHLGNLIQARSRVSAALEIIESMRTQIPSQGLRTSYFTSKRVFYEFYVDLLAQLHEHHPGAGYDEEALRTSERARARSLLETLAEARVDIRQGVDPELLKRERLLRQQLNAKEAYRLQLLNNNPREAAAVDQELKVILNEYEDVQARIRARSPRFAALMQPAARGRKEIQERVLDEETLLLEYMLGDERSFLWAITRNSAQSFKLPKRAEIERAARQAYRLLTSSHYRRHRRAAQLAAGELSRILLAPVATELGKRRLVIVADGALQYLPFGALPEPPAPGDGSGGNGPEAGNWLLSHNPQPLIVRHEIVNLPSASVLAEIRRGLAGRAPADKPLAILADPVLYRDDPRSKYGQGLAGPGSGQPSTALRHEQLLETPLTLSARESGVNRFERLQFARLEADAISVLVPDENVLKALDFDANRAAAMNAELSQYRILHFAAHGLINSQHPELSGIVLSLVDHRGQPQDGFLRTHDIYNLKLGADLVVLSACQTALGKEIRGEGLVGLVRGFMYAGVPRIVASLWDVRDEATAELMKRFYTKMLREGKRPAAALREAQISMWKEKRWEAPYYWAGFVLLGEWK